MENVSTNVDLNPLIAAILTNAMFVNESNHQQKNTGVAKDAIMSEVLTAWSNITSKIQEARRNQASPDPKKWDNL